MIGKTESKKGCNLSAICPKTNIGRKRTILSVFITILYIFLTVCYGRHLILNRDLGLEDQENKI